MKKPGHKKTINPPQSQSKQPGIQSKMHPQPISIYDDYQGSNKLENKVAIITGGDSGIGRAVVYHFAAENAKIVFTYLNESDDANSVKDYLTKNNVDYLAFKGDLGDQTFVNKIIKEIISRYKQIDCLVNNIAEQHPIDDFEKISSEQLEKTFKTNVFSFFYMTQAALSNMDSDSTIINSTSVTAYRGSSHLIDYAATKGAIVSFTRSLAKNLVDKNIRVNAVAPGPVWTPLIPASFTEAEVAEFGSQAPMGKPAQPADIAPCYVFLASKDSRFMTGQILHPNGGEIVGS